VARRGGFLSASIKIAKAIDKASQQAAKNAERLRKEDARNHARFVREQERLRKAGARDQARLLREQKCVSREKEKEAKQYEKGRIADAKLDFKEKLASAKYEYDDRCKERADLRKHYIQEVLK
jgi:hypothetical protein